ncbi:hypothetical protein MUGA111182_02930 [Mucilaginibacter galii]
MRTTYAHKLGSALFKNYPPKIDWFTPHSIDT